MWYVTIPGTLEGFVIVCTGSVLVPFDWYPVTLAGTADDVQTKVVEGTFDVSVTAVVLSPVQMVCCMGLLVTLGDGLTLTV
jgi:hypothetical protein